MRTEGRLLIFLSEIAIFHEVFSDEIAVGRGFSECDALSAGAHLAILEHHRCRVEAEFRSEEHTSELQSLMRISYAVFCLKKKKKKKTNDKAANSHDDTDAQHIN